jgi:hypothetical protein
VCLRDVFALIACAVNALRTIPQNVFPTLRTHLTIGCLVSMLRAMHRALIRFTDTFPGCPIRPIIFWIVQITVEVIFPTPRRIVIERRNLDHLMDDPFYAEGLNNLFVSEPDFNGVAHVRQHWHVKGSEVRVVLIKKGDCDHFFFRRLSGSFHKSCWFAIIFCARLLRHFIHAGQSHPASASAVVQSHSSSGSKSKSEGSSSS